ncbi:MAG: hypothetical protein IJW03_04215 [Clostridia bacterium]|nr:hypothetical protein [Clostridia bacterium]
MDEKYGNLPKELVEALKRCDLLVGRETLEYAYNLYDPETGGFYYSISSRDLEGMTPFAEGTRFMMENLNAGGIESPDWHKELVGNWILNHQDESDGYFYEDLWGKTTSGPRIDRDLTYSKGILAYCGMKPLYATPDERLKNKEDNATIPDYLKSEENMIAWLDSMDWTNKRIWGTGQRISSAVVLIKAAGLDRVVYEYILKKQNPETALWGDTLDWMSTNGGMKISSFLKPAGYPFPNVSKMIDTVLELFASGIPAEHATYIWNPFVLLSNAISTLPEGEREQMREKLYANGADIVNFAVDSALKLKRPDGGFSSNLGRAQFTQQGYLYGLGLTDESDVDGTVIAGHRLRATINATFGVSVSRDYYAGLGDEFWERCKNKPSIVKTKMLDDYPDIKALKK